MINENQIVPYQATELPAEEGPWLVFAPHADDESFGMGGTLAKATARGIRVRLVVMTDGALGGSQENLAELRKAEAVKAAAVLGLEPPVFLDKRDRELKMDADTLARVGAEIESLKPAAVFFPGPFELHPDHRATAVLVWQALGQLGPGAPIPFSYEILVQSPVNTLVDISAYTETKKAAMVLYQSQLEENRYIDIALALNSLRTLTLPAGCTHAEGFYRYDQADLEQALPKIIADKIARLFQE